MGVPPDNALLRALPSVDEILNAPHFRQLFAGQPRERTVRAARMAVTSARQRLLAGELEGFLEADVSRALQALGTPNLRPVHNATGVVLHTNLGRAPLAPEAVERMATVAAGYCNLEYDLDEGERGSRYAAVVGLLCELTGAEDAMVVNNGAAAALLALIALGHRKDGVISRGELVEIGGGFRVPDVMRQSGVKLLEVGTTNRTRLSDYEQALGPRTGLLIKVHRSNFAQVGFVEDTPVAALAALAARSKLPLYVDMGSGQLEVLVGAGLTPEPSMRSVVEEGADVVSFSGDKLLGGPQAGVLVGRRRVLEALRRHPLTRAVRVDKLLVAALEATLELYRDGRSAEVPARRMLLQSPPQLKARATRLTELLFALQVRSRVVETVGQVGGGTMPLGAPPSYGVVLHGEPQRGLGALRMGRVPVIARVSEGQVLLDVLCLTDGELPSVAEAVVAAGFTRQC